MPFCLISTTLDATIVGLFLLFSSYLQPAKDHDQNHFLQIIALGGADATLFMTTCITQVSSNRFHQRSLRNGWRFLMMILF
jgi:alpha-mannosidase